MNCYQKCGMVGCDRVFLLLQQTQPGMAGEVCPWELHSGRSPLHLQSVECSRREAGGRRELVASHPLCAPGRHPLGFGHPKMPPPCCMDFRGGRGPQACAGNHVPAPQPVGNLPSDRSTGGAEGRRRREGPEAVPWPTLARPLPLSLLSPGLPGNLQSCPGGRPGTMRRFPLVLWVLRQTSEVRHGPLHAVR